MGEAGRPLTVSELLLAHTAETPDFPSPGVLFRDLNPLFASASAFSQVLEFIAERWSGTVDLVAGIEARGLIVGAPLAQRMGIGFIPIRKKGKLPGRTLTRDYDLEYGTATIEIPYDACARATRVLIVDDVLATGGTVVAASELISDAGGEVIGIDVLLEISELRGRDRLPGHRIEAVATV